jgi:16S rRNA (uracil1498-N3)-methyltransferase
MRRFFIPPEQLRSTQILLAGEDAHHLRNVLRLGPGDTIVVFDGTGVEYTARIVSLDQGQVRLELQERLTDTRESPLTIALAQGYLKDKKMDELVRRLTELGVQHYIPFMARRSVATPDEGRSRARTQRWRKISQEAVKQCRRSRTMIIAAPTPFSEVLDLAEPYDLRLIFWQGDGGKALNALPVVAKPHRVFLLIGPEGGFEAEEVSTAQQHGFVAVHMGPRTLRAETATVAACTLVQFVFGDMGQNLLDNPKPVL